jgi:hypothetical protein
MNFQPKPELHWTLGHPFALLLMAAVCASLYLIFNAAAGCDPTSTAGFGGSHGRRPGADRNRDHSE